MFKAGQIVRVELGAFKSYAGVVEADQRGGLVRVYSLVSPDGVIYAGTHTFWHEDLAPTDGYWAPAQLATLRALAKATA